MQSVDTGLAILHIATGAFFLTTGARKVFLPSVRNKVLPFIMARTHVPKPCAWAVILGELKGGAALLLGFLTQWAALGLIVIMLGAFLSDTLPAVRAKQAQGDHWSKFLSNALCTPEAQLIVILATLALTGAGAFSVDALLS